MITRIYGKITGFMNWVTEPRGGPSDFMDGFDMGPAGYERWQNEINKERRLEREEKTKGSDNMTDVNHMSKYIRIVRAGDPLYWYADSIGEVFEVEDDNPYGSNYTVSERIDQRIRLVDVGDAVTVSGEELAQSENERHIIELSKTVAQLRKDVDALKVDRIADALGERYSVAEYIRRSFE